MTTDQHTFELRNDVDRIVGLWDAQRLSQVFYNLLSNAVKYSPQGGLMEVRVSEHNREVLVCLKDEGIGSPREAQARLFDQYYRTAAAAKSGAEGMGLGLYVSQGIVSAHGGRLWVESDGTSFYFTLPLPS